MTKKISQRQARRTRRELRELQANHHSLIGRYASASPGKHICQNISINYATRQVLDVASVLGYSLVAKVNGNTLDIYAVRS